MYTNTKRKKENNMNKYELMIISQEKQTPDPTPSDLGKFDIGYLIRRLKNMETNPQFFDQMITYDTTRVRGEENKSLKNIGEEFKKFATLNADDIDIKSHHEPVCPFHPISKNPGESYELLSQSIPMKIPVDFESLNNNPKLDGLTLTVYNRRLCRGGNNNDNQ